MLCDTRVHPATKPYFILVQALEFTKPGNYIANIGGVGAQHVRIKNVTNEAGQLVRVDQHHFEHFDSRKVKADLTLTVTLTVTLLQSLE